GRERRGKARAARIASARLSSLRLYTRWTERERRGVCAGQPDSERTRARCKQSSSSGIPGPVNARQRACRFLFPAGGWNEIRRGFLHVAREGVRLVCYRAELRFIWSAGQGYVSCAIASGIG